MLVRTLTSLALAAATAAVAQETAPPKEDAAAPAPTGGSEQRTGSGPVDPPPPATESPKPPPPRTVTGTVRSVDGNPPRVVIEASDGPVTAAIDRNTVIYLDRGMGTVRDLRAGEPVRVSVSGTENRALWVELTKKAAKPEGSSAATPPTIPPGELGAPAGAGAVPAPSTAPPGPGTPAGAGTPGP